MRTDTVLLLVAALLVSITVIVWAVLLTRDRRDD
jgi:hypothetical protein